MLEDGLSHGAACIRVIFLLHECMHVFHTCHDRKRENTLQFHISYQRVHTLGKKEKKKKTALIVFDKVHRVYSFSYFKYGIYKPRDVKKIR